MAPVFDKPPTPPVNGTQNAPAPPQPSSSTGVTLKTSLPEVKKPPVPQNRGLKKVTSEDDTSLVWRMFSIVSLSTMRGYARS
ncbi:hypothetical protein R1sor_019423 [Riccia sorocarpa]|uniref:Uncharacterized protein n=1 Tax=Riccia sorocarpa TaxID=122646 RepID=A0ABD3IDK1_9MARC